MHVHTRVRYHTYANNGKYRPSRKRGKNSFLVLPVEKDGKRGIEGRERFVKTSNCIGLFAENDLVAQTHTHTRARTCIPYACGVGQRRSVINFHIHFPNIPVKI